MSPPLNSPSTKWALSESLGNGKFPKEEGGCEGKTRKQNRRQVCGARSSLPPEPLLPASVICRVIVRCHLTISSASCPHEMRGRDGGPGLGQKHGPTTETTCEVNKEQVLVSSALPVFRWTDKLMHHA